MQGTFGWKKFDQLSMVEFQRLNIFKYFGSEQLNTD
jgi:hypothetical protein